MSDDDDPVSEWIAQLKAGDSEAPGHIWKHFFERLRRLARHKLGGTARRAADEEDVVVSIFDAAFQGIKEGRFPKLDDRDDLWQIVLMLAKRKVSDLRRHETAAKRDSRRAKHESDFANGGDGSSGPGGLSQLEGREPDPEEDVVFNEELQRVIALLPDKKFLAVAGQSLAGYPPPEVAARLGMSLRSVERKLSFIRRLWKAERVE